jgi:outer membrane protein TolC
MCRPAWGLLLGVAIFAAGCSSYHAYYERAADRDILDILESHHDQAVGRWQKNVRQPEPIKASMAELPEGYTPGKPLVLSLADAIRTATKNNRTYKNELEAIQLSALALSTQRRNFGPIVSNTISYVYADAAAAAGTGTTGASVGVSKIVPTGGTASVTTSGSHADTFGSGPGTFSHDVTVSFSQPLLRGFGREVAYESLTQAQRNVLYALRDFELFRQDFYIDVVRRYYSIFRQKQVVENSQRSYDQFKFLRRRSEALFKSGKVTAIDKFRAVQSELVASNELITEQEQLASLLDEFRVFLNLPRTVSIDVESIKPTARSADINLVSAVNAALHNRLDLKTDVQRLEDAERGVRIAKNGLLPDLDLTASWSVDGTRTGGSAPPYMGSHSVGVELTLPFDKVADRNAYKSSLIRHQRRKRALDLSRDSIRVEVRNTYRRLRRLANSVRIQTANVEIAKKRVENATLRFKAGELGNRDVVEAQAAELASRNRLISAILDYEVTRLQLKRDIGILLITKEGSHIE